MFVTGRRKTRLLDLYEHENRSSDGSVWFDSIESSRTHGANRNLFRVIIIMGFFTGVFGVILICYGLGLISYP